MRLGELLGAFRGPPGVADRVAALGVGDVGEDFGEAHHALAALARLHRRPQRVQGLWHVLGVEPEPELVGVPEIEQLRDDAGVERDADVAADRGRQSAPR